MSRQAATTTCEICHGTLERVYRRDFHPVHGIQGPVKLHVRYPINRCQRCGQLWPALDTHWVLDRAEAEFAEKQAIEVHGWLRREWHQGFGLACIALPLGFSLGCLWILASSLGNAAMAIIGSGCWLGMFAAIMLLRLHDRAAHTRIQQLIRPSKPPPHNGRRCR